MEKFFAARKRVEKALRREEGFTLVEMAIALVIMAIVIGVILLGSRQTVQNSKVDAASQQLSTIRGAVISYQAKYNGYPDSGLDTPGIQAYLPAPPSSQYVYACDTTNGVSLTYTAGDATEASAVLAEWVKQLGTGSATTNGAYIDASAPTVVVGNIYYGAVTCDSTD